MSGLGAVVSVDDDGVVLDVGAVVVDVEGVVDDVAVDFPRLTILLAHGGRPIWMDAAFFLVRRHPNVHLEVSGIPPAKLLEYFPRIEEIADKVIWGTDWPSPGVRTMRGNVDAFLRLPLGDDTKRKILYDNAARLLG